MIRNLNPHPEPCLTTIALLRSGTQPLMLSDMLLSRTPTSGATKQFFLPTLGDVSAVAAAVGRPLPFEPTRMVRKMFNVGAQMHVAWAGDLSAGLALRAKLLELNAGAMDMESAFDEAIGCLPLDQQKSTSAIALCLPAAAGSRTSPVPSAVYAHGCISYDSPRWGRCWFGGSGGHVLCDRIETADAVMPVVQDDDPLELAAEHWCARLVFSESMVRKAPSGGDYDPLLRAGCGGFYEVSRFAPGGVVVPRDSAHVHLRYASDGSLWITRLYTYSTHCEDAERGRSAIVASFVSEPVKLDATATHMTFKCADADFIICNPFWLDADGGDRRHMHVRSKEPGMLLRPGPMRLEAFTLSVFREDEHMPLNAVAHLSDAARQRILEGPGAPRKFVTQAADHDDPQVRIEAVDSNVRIRVSVDWLLSAVARFDAEVSGGHLVVLTPRND